MIKLDEKDKKILEILMKNGREKVTTIAKKIGLSVDATNKRIKKLVEEGVFSFGIYILPPKIGYNLTSNAWVKLRDFSEEDYNKFIEYLKKHPRVTTLLSITGYYDLNIVIMVRDTLELEKIIRSIRTKFSHIIDDWTTILVTNVHKFEEYDLGEI